MQGALWLRHISAALVAATALAAVTAASAQPAAKRTLRVSSDGNGTVTSRDSRINCGTRCSAKYSRGTVVTLRAAPKQFFAFQRWSGACVGTSPSCVVALDNSTRVRAAFQKRQASALLSVSGPGTVVSSSGLLCGREGTVCDQTVDAGTTVTLTPIAADGGAFGVWGGDCAGAGLNPCTLVVDEDGVEILAAFRHTDPDPDQPQLSVDPEGLHITSDPPGIDCPPLCQAEFPSGTLVTLRGGSGRWNGLCVGSTTSCLLILDNSDGTATGGPPPPPAPRLLGINVSVSGPGTVAAVGGGIRCGAKQTLLDCAGSYGQGTIVVLRATPARRGRFVRWSGFCFGKKRTCTLRVTAPKDVQAFFRR